MCFKENCLNSTMAVVQRQARRQIVEQRKESEQRNANGIMSAYSDKYHGNGVGHRKLGGIKWKKKCESRGGDKQWLWRENNVKACRRNREVDERERDASVLSIDKRVDSRELLI